MMFVIFWSLVWLGKDASQSCLHSVKDSDILGVPMTHDNRCVIHSLGIRSCWNMDHKIHSFLWWCALFISGAIIKLIVGRENQCFSTPNC